MREIIFKAWDTKKKVMHTSFSSDLLISLNGLLVQHSGMNGLMDEYENCVLLQFTGFLDKNGIKIFEGDIIQEDCMDTEKGTKLVSYVKFDDGGFQTDDGEFLVNAIQSFTVKVETDQTSAEVLGNIYQHKDLVKKYKLKV
jgi:uncharacterized phage protein (TIGR01671 family)